MRNKDEEDHTIANFAAWRTELPDAPIFCGTVLPYNMGDGTYDVRTRMGTVDCAPAHLMAIADMMLAHATDLLNDKLQFPGDDPMRSKIFANIMNARKALYPERPPQDNVLESLLLALDKAGQDDRIKAAMTDFVLFGRTAVKSYIWAKDGGSDDERWKNVPPPSPELMAHFDILEKQTKIFRKAINACLDPEPDDDPSDDQNFLYFLDAYLTIWLEIDCGNGVYYHPE